MKADLSTPGLARPTRVRYGVLGFACALSMITYLDRVCFGTVAPYIQNEFGLSNSQLGYLFTAFALAYAAFEVPTGWLGDIYGARKTLIRIVLWWSVFTALTGTIYPSIAWPGLGFVMLLLVRFFFGIGEAGAYPNISRAGQLVSVQRTRLRAGRVWMAGRFAGGMSPLAVLALVYMVVTPDGERVVHWRHIFWIFGVIGADLVRGLLDVVPRTSRGTPLGERRRTAGDPRRACGLHAAFDPERGADSRRQHRHRPGAARSSPQLRSWGCRRRSRKRSRPLRRTGRSRTETFPGGRC